MKYLLIEHVERGHGSSEDIHRFDSLDLVYQYIKDSGNLFEFFALYAVNEIKLDKNILDAIPSKPKTTTWYPIPSLDLINITIETKKRRIQSLRSKDVITFDSED